MTLQDCIARYEAQRGAQTALTPLGQTTANVRRLKQSIAALDADGRAAVRTELAALVAELDGVAWSDFGSALTRTN